MLSGLDWSGSHERTARHRARRAARRGLLVVAALVLVTPMSACGQETPNFPTATSSTSAGSPITSAPTTSPYGQESSAPAPIVYRPPYIDRVEWTDTAVGPSLSVFPTTSGRYTTDAGAMAAAWAEVLDLDATADTPGMQAQFDCHWRFARIIEPEKPSWNLEPGRPVVTEEDMVGAGCNPGFAEE